MSNDADATVGQLQNQSNRTLSISEFEKLLDRIIRAKQPGQEKADALRNCLGFTAARCPTSETIPSWLPAPLSCAKSPASLHRGAGC